MALTRPSTQRALPQVALPSAAAERSPPRRRLGRFRTAWGARTQILATYIILLTLSAVISMLAIREVLILRLNDRTEDASQQEILELERLLAVGRDPETGRPFTTPE